MRFRPYKTYAGDAQSIAKQIVFSCWNGRYFQVSNGNFQEFYMRDFGYVVESLLRLGYKEEVFKTLAYALTIFQREKRITTTITSYGKAIDIFGLAPDSLALLLRSLRVSKNKELVKQYAPFLNQQISFFVSHIFDADTSLVKRKTYFSSAKDHAVRDSATYDNVMLAAIQKEAKMLSLDNPLKGHKIKKAIIGSLWTGSYFQDDLSQNIVSGDANLYPYWMNIFTSKKMMKSSIQSIEEKKLTFPFPLKYTTKEDAKRCTFLKPQKYVVPNYEGDTLWAHHGMNYLSLLKKADKKRFCLHYAQHKRCIETYGTFLEVYFANGKPYKTPFYKADAGMLWAAIFAAL